MPAPGGARQHRNCGRSLPNEGRRKPAWTGTAGTYLPHALGKVAVDGLAW